MNLTDNLTKGFLTGSGQWVNNGKSIDLARWSNYEDPTYMGFYFNINEYGYYDPTNLDLDVLPQGLFMPFTAGVNSSTSSSANELGNTSGYFNISDGAESYLRRRGEYYRAGMISEFREGFLNLVRYEPWSFEKVTGVETLLKVTPGNSLRAKDIKLTFDCNETISMRMSYLVDCYRKGSFDYVNMRYSMPDNQRYFSMDLWVTEIRFMKRPVAGTNNTTFFNTGSFLRFRLDYCEFDLIEDPGLSYTSDLARYASDKPASLKITIKVGAIRETNNYGILGGFLTDTRYGWQRGLEALEKSFTQNTSIKNGTGEYVNTASDTLSAIENNNDFGFRDERSRNSSTVLDPNTDLGATEWVEQRALFSQTGLPDDQFSFGVGNTNKGSANQNPGDVILSGQKTETSLTGESVNLESAQTDGEGIANPISPINADLSGSESDIVVSNLGSVDVGSRARSLAGNLLRAAFLGNVYGLSLTTLAGQIQGILNNPVAALQGIFSRFTRTSQEATTLAENVQLSSSDISLLKDFIGNIQEIQSVTAGTSLQDATLGELTQISPPIEKAQVLKEDLKSNTKTSLLQSDLGKILFSSNTPITPKNLSKETLDGNKSTLNQEMSPIKEPLVGDKQNVNLDNAKVVLEGKKTTLNSSGLGNIGFTKK